MDTWQKAHKLTVQALHDPPNARDKKLLSKVLRKPLPVHLEKRLFELDAYLRIMTSMSLSAFICRKTRFMKFTNFYRSRSPRWTVRSTLSYEPFVRAVSIRPTL